VLAAVALFVSVATGAAQDNGPVPAYLERGHRTEAHQKVLREQVERFYRALSQALRRNAPKLRREIEPPPPAAHGYQILPKIVKDTPAPSPPGQAKVVPFNWNLTDTRIERQRGAPQGARSGPPISFEIQSNDVLGELVVDHVVRAAHKEI
jgi:hypothetical protein